MCAIAFGSFHINRKNVRQMINKPYFCFMKLQIFSFLHHNFSDVQVFGGRYHLGCINRCYNCVYQCNYSSMVNLIDFLYFGEIVQFVLI